MSWFKQSLALYGIVAYLAKLCEYAMDLFQKGINGEQGFFYAYGSIKMLQSR